MIMAGTVLVILPHFNRAPVPVYDCGRLFALAASEHDIIIALVARPECAVGVSDSLVGPFAPALDQ
jgi:hypothetical protein